MSFDPSLRTRCAAVLVLFGALGGLGLSVWLSYVGFRRNFWCDGSGCMGGDTSPLLACDQALDSSWSAFLGVPWSLWSAAHAVTVVVLALALLRARGPLARSAPAILLALGVAAVAVSAVLGVYAWTHFEHLCRFCVGLYMYSALVLGAAAVMRGGPGRRDLCDLAIDAARSSALAASTATRSRRTSPGRRVICATGCRHIAANWGCRRCSWSRSPGVASICARSSRPVCAPREPMCRARRGEQCHDCDCAVGLQCGADKRCHPEGEASVAPTCADPAVRAAIDKMTRACRARKRSVQEQAEADAGCSADEWRQLLAENADVGDILAASPDRFAVYFPANEPRRGQSWPGAEQAAVSRQLAAHGDALRDASAVFIIGRATPDGRPEDDNQLAVRRLNAVERLLDPVLHAGKKPSERAGGPMVASWGARSERSIPLDTFIRDFAGVHAPIARTTAESEQLAADMARAGELSQPQRDALERRLNRVALIVPIRCPLGGARG